MSSPFPAALLPGEPQKTLPGSGGIRTHAPAGTGALIQRLRPLGHATPLETPKISMENDEEEKEVKKKKGGEFHQIHTGAALVFSAQSAALRFARPERNKTFRGQKEAFLLRCFYLLRPSKGNTHQSDPPPPPLIGGSASQPRGEARRGPGGEPRCEPQPRPRSAAV